MKHGVKWYVGFLVIRSIASLFYFTGLAALIPLVPALFAGGEVGGAVAIATSLIVISFCTLYFFSGSRRVAWKTLGVTTMVPGLIAVVFLFIGKGRVQQIYEMLGILSPIIRTYVAEFVPKVWLLAGIYIMLGVLFYLASERAPR